MFPVTQNRWWIVVASTLSMTVASGPIAVFAAGVFLKPVAADLGFGRGEISTAIGLASICIAVTTPFLGRLVDVRGLRPVLLTWIACFALANAALALLQASAVMLFVMYAVFGLAATGQGPTAYSKVLSARFDRRRGLVLGITLAGVGIGTALMPQLATWLVGDFGWRVGYIGLGVAVFVLAFVPVLLWVPNMPAVGPGAPSADAPAFRGMSFAEAVRSGKYWALTIAFFFGATVINGSLIQVMPLLTDRGMSPAAAATTLSASGLALICARIFSGWCADKLYAPYIAIFFLLCPVVGIAILASGWGAPVFGTILLGAGIGAEIDLMSFMIGRYFGIRYFGSLHGFMFAFAAFGNFVGSAALGWSFQLLGSYGPAFALFEIMLAIAIVIFTRLGPYAYPAPRRESPGIGGNLTATSVP